MARDDRVFVSDGRKHFRRRYSVTELRIGLVVLAVLAAIVGWVAWKGAHPDPTLFGEGVAPPGGAAGEVSDASRSAPGEVGDAPRSAPAAAHAPVDRGVMPEGLAAPGWTEGPVSRFGYDNLFEKINGREGYYKGFGFRELTFVSLVNDADPGQVVDIELFDQGEAGNALGAYAGERPAGVDTEIGDSGLGHLDRNALLMTRGRYYARVIGSDESPGTVDQLRHVRGVLAASLPGEPLPYGFAFFAGVLGISPGRVSLIPENAFSFGFARNVYAALLDDDETELWITLAADPAAAEQLAGQFVEGFASYGTVAQGNWVEDRYIHSFSTAAHAGRWVYGVRGAPTLDEARPGLERLAGALAGFPPPAEAPAAGDDSSDDAPVDDY